MALTEWLWFLLVITTDKARGNALAALIDPDIGGHLTFDRGLKLRPIGSTDTEPTAWAASSPLKALGVDYCAEFTGQGPYPLLTALGLTAEQIAEHQACMTLAFGPRAEYEGGLEAFLAAHGYEVIPAA